MNRIVCLKPFYAMEFTMRGEVFPCCPAWPRERAGDISQNTIAEIWNGPEYTQLRQAMLDGNWEQTCTADCPYVAAYLRGESPDPTRLTECDDYQCLTPKLIEEIRAGKTRLESTPTKFTFGNSSVCNLDCVMCHAKQEADDPALVQKTIYDVWAYLPKARELTLTDQGEPFARPDTKRILLEFDGSCHPGLKINLRTNGLLIPEYWDRIKYQNFGWVNVAIDAATKETYEAIRRGGKWEQVMKTLHLLGENRHRFSYILIGMAVSKANYRELPAFIELGEQFGFLPDLTMVRLENPPADMPADWCFYQDRSSAEYKEFQDIVRDCMSTDYDIGTRWGDLPSFIR